VANKHPIAQNGMGGFAQTEDENPYARAEKIICDGA
jgi:hypothetical protein